MQLEDLFVKFPVIETERLILRQFTLDDAQAFFLCISDPDIWRYSRRPAQTSLEETIHSLKNLPHRYEKRTTAPWAMVLTDHPHPTPHSPTEDSTDDDHRAAL